MAKLHTPRWAWALTGSGHFFTQSFALIHELEHCDIFVSKAANEVLRMYGLKLDFPKTMRVLHDKTASAVPVGGFYHGVYHTVVVAPATSNTVAKCVFGISDTLVTNVFAQAGKCRVPAIVFACDTAPSSKPWRRTDRSRSIRERSTWRTPSGSRASNGPGSSSRSPTWRRLSSGGGPNSRAMAERLIFLTGHLAKARLERLLAGLGETEFAWEIVDVGVKVAALMTEDIIRRRVKLAEGASRIILPGRYRGDLERLAAHFGIPFVRGPDEIADLPAFLGRAGVPPDLSRHDMRIFAEIVDAPMLSIEALLAQGEGAARRQAPT